MANTEVCGALCDSRARLATVQDLLASTTSTMGYTLAIFTLGGLDATFHFTQPPSAVHGAELLVDDTDTRTALLLTTVTASVVLTECASGFGKFTAILELTLGTTVMIDALVAFGMTRLTTSLDVADDTALTVSMSTTSLCTTCGSFVASFHIASFPTTMIKTKFLFRALGFFGAPCILAQIRWSMKRA